MSKNPTKFGTFSGVFTPTVITILGVIMYLREGWVVGHAGLGGAWLIIGISIAIATATGLSLSSIATNTQIKAGGAYAIISRSLGLEIGTTVGLALYIAQALAITMYIFGFREGWLSLFPNHSPMFVDLILFGVIGFVALKSAKLSFQLQYFVMAVTVLSIVVAAFGTWNDNPAPIVWWNLNSAQSGEGFWVLFAVFFPAVTGVMAGAAMSGELKNPTRSIPIGTIGAIAVSAVVYFYMAYILARMGTPQELTNHTDILILKSGLPWFMSFAILCATASSALATLVGAPRILQAVAMDNMIPFAERLKIRSADGEPRNATMITACIALLALTLRDLNSIAPLITVCFLSTYAMINGVVLIEQGMGLVSFRPRLRLPIVIPALGLLGSLLAMMVITPALSLSILGFMALAYDWLSRKDRDAEHADVRGNLFVALAQWAALRAESLPRSESRAWRPYPMVPIIGQSTSSIKLACQLLSPGDSVKLIELTKQGDESVERDRSFEHITESGMSYSITNISYDQREQALGTTIQALRASFFRPNILCLSLENNWTESELTHVIHTAHSAKLGVVLRAEGRQLSGSAPYLNVWIRPQSPRWDITQTVGSMDLSILIALRLSARTGHRIRLVSTIPNNEERNKARHFLAQVIEAGRLDRQSELQLIVGDFESARALAPEAEAQIFGLPTPYRHQTVQDISNTTKGHVLFVRGSGKESVLD